MGKIARRADLFPSLLCDDRSPSPHPTEERLPRSLNRPRLCCRPSPTLTQFTRHTAAAAAAAARIRLYHGTAPGHGDARATSPFSAFSTPKRCKHRHAGPTECSRGERDARMGRNCRGMGARRGDLRIARCRGRTTPAVAPAESAAEHGRRPNGAIAPARSSPQTTAHSPCHPRRPPRPTARPAPRPFHTTPPTPGTPRTPRPAPDVCAPKNDKNEGDGAIGSDGAIGNCPVTPITLLARPMPHDAPRPGVYAPKNEGDGGNRPIVPVVRRWVAHPARPRPGDHPYAAATVVSAPRCSNAVAQPPKRRCCTCNISASPESDALAIPIARHSPSSPPFHDLPRPTARPGYADKACTPTTAPYAPPPTAVVSAPENTDDDVACVRPTLTALAPAAGSVSAPRTRATGRLAFAPPSVLPTARPRPAARTGHVDKGRVHPPPPLVSAPPRTRVMGRLARRHRSATHPAHPHPGDYPHATAASTPRCLNPAVPRRRNFFWSPFLTAARCATLQTSTVGHAHEGGEV
ncbi:hypothetical protein B0H17DRAFT_1129074 [Mycena rosella]|uniref:Uncharacterized protein n=1 Tax=Mycena rosella TaxID=1033263 RepID=A0AAD7DVN4_MYCRO|nr:hypothetical protein B0H17DRAFT_1129074 [Mycena rosella]